MNQLTFRVPAPTQQMIHRVNSTGVRKAAGNGTDHPKGRDVDRSVGISRRTMA
jgi:hypothetical protein